MTHPSPAVTAALARLDARWGAAAPRSGGLGVGTAVGTVVGALATAPLPVDHAPDPASDRAPELGQVHPTGFAALDAILGRGGLPRGTFAAVAGGPSSGRTTVALRLAAEAQAAGAIVAWLDLAAAFDPVEAVARGVSPEWLVVVTPADLDEGLAIAGALLAGRTVDLLVLDLPTRPATGGPAAGRSAPARSSGGRRPGLGDRLGRLAALGRRVGCTVVVLEPPGLTPAVATAVTETAGLRLELVRRSWVRLGRDVVGQRTEVTVARNRAGPSGRRTVIRILYADGGERDACLRRSELLVEPLTDAPALRSLPEPVDAPPPSPPPSAPPRSQPGTPALRLMAGGTDRPRRDALDRRSRPRGGPGGQDARRPTRDAARVGPPAGAGGDIPRSGPGG